MITTLAHILPIFFFLSSFSSSYRLILALESKGIWLKGPLCTVRTQGTMKYEIYMTLVSSCTYMLHITAGSLKVLSLYCGI